MTRRPWASAELEIVRKLYPDVPTRDVAALLGRSEKSVYQRARNMGLCKSPAFFSSDLSGRIKRGKQHPAMVASQFKPGHASWNTGLKGWQAGGRSAETRFKPRRPEESRNYCPIGSLRTSKDGYLERKVNDTNPVPARRWVSVHRLVWEAEHGPIPPKHIVVFRPGQRTNTLELITIDKLECISRAENARRNHPRSKNPELGRLVQLKGAITRQLNRIIRMENKGPQHDR